MTTAVALTAILAATLFVLFDSVRTVQETRGHLASIGRSIVGELAGISPDAVSSRLSSVVSRYSPGARVRLVSADAPVPATLVSQQLPAGELGVLAVDMEQAEAFAGVWQRGLGAYGMAILLAGLTFRRRRATQMPDALQRHNYQTLATAIPMGVACWTLGGQLIVCNDQYRNRLNLRGENLSYQEAV
ncbi:MAG TPA: hypothetical protein VL133_10270, partial [Devosia sp.]|nr:hypothetical protein [Devosia sp.]